MRILCILLPNIPLRCEISRRPEIKGCSVIVIQPENAGSSQKIVLDFSPELEGLQPGMSLQRALSRHGEVKIIQADLPYYWSVFNEILDNLELKSPLVEGTDLGQIYIGVEGLQLIYPDDRSLINAMQEAIPETFNARMGIAEGKFLAYLAALHSHPAEGYRVLGDNITNFLKDLPCDVLPISVKSKSKLRNFGLHTLGQISELPPGPLQAQFGPEGQKIRELSGGYDYTPLYPRCTEGVIEEETTLSSVTVTLEALLVTLESLLSRAFTAFGPRGLGIRSIVLWTRTWNSGYWERGVRFKEPAMSVKSAMTRIKQVMENYPQPGPVEQIGMRITGLGHQRGQQKSLFSEIRARDRLLDDIRQLDLRLGSPQVFKIKEIEPWSRIPERRYVLAPLSR
jgi:DNA polymerase-4/protein ImuB